jgi:transposase-like protein
MKLRCIKCSSESIMDFGSPVSKFFSPDQNLPDFRFLKSLRGETQKRFECMDCNHQFEVTDWTEYRKVLKKQKKETNLDM